MSLLAKTKERLLQSHAYRAGRVPLEAILGFFHAIENAQGNGVSIPDLTVGSVTAQSSTASAAFVTGTGRAYGFLGTSPSAATADVIVQLTDNDIVIASARVKAAKAAEVYLFGAGDGIGVEFGTNLKVKAVQIADGSSNPASGDRPSVVVLYGDDTVNTSSSNLLVSTYG